MKYKIAVITGSRADYGLLRPLIKLIDKDNNYITQLIVTGSHLSPEFGQTEKEIYLDHFKVADKLDILLSSNTRSAMAKSAGLAIISFSDSFRKLNPDLIICLGDRYEIFSAAYSACIMDIPIAHIHGGELTYGAIDDQLRHAITKASSIHFPSTQIYKKRIIQMGEQPTSVHEVGALGVERALKVEQMSITEMENELKIKLDGPYFLVTVHSATKGLGNAKNLISEVLEALNNFSEYTIIMSYANADIGGYEINKYKKIFCKKRPLKRILKKSLGHKLYINLLRNSSVVIGNSSSGVIEAPILGVPSVNIGNRQDGRLLLDSVIKVKTDKVKITKGINKALSNKDRIIMKDFGAGNTSELIFEHLKSFLDSDDSEKVKIFYDIEY